MICLICSCLVKMVAFHACYPDAGPTSNMDGYFSNSVVKDDSNENFIASVLSKEWSNTGRKEPALNSKIKLVFLLLFLAYLSVFLYQRTVISGQQLNTIELVNPTQLENSASRNMESMNLNNINNGLPHNANTNEKKDGHQLLDDDIDGSYELDRADPHNLERILRNLEYGFFLSKYPQDQNLEIYTVVNEGYYSFGPSELRRTFKKDRTTHYYTVSLMIKGVLEVFKEEDEVALVINISNGLMDTVPDDSFSQELDLCELSSTLHERLKFAKDFDCYPMENEKNQDYLLYLPAVPVDNYQNDKGLINPYNVDVITYAIDFKNKRNLNEGNAKMMQYYTDTITQKLRCMLFAAALMKVDVLVIMGLGTETQGVDSSAIVYNLYYILTYELLGTFKKVIFGEYGMNIQLLRVKFDSKYNHHPESSNVPKLLAERLNRLYYEDFFQITNIRSSLKNQIEHIYNWWVDLAQIIGKDEDIYLNITINNHSASNPLLNGNNFLEYEGIEIPLFNFIIESEIWINYGLSSDLTSYLSNILQEESSRNVNYLPYSIIVTSNESNGSPALQRFDHVIFNNHTDYM